MKLYRIKFDDGTYVEAQGRSEAEALMAVYPRRGVDVVSCEPVRAKLRDAHSESISRGDCHANHQ